jgi:hypothetical protein
VLIRERGSLCFFSSKRQALLKLFFKAMPRQQQ